MISTMLLCDAGIFWDCTYCLGNTGEPFGGHAYIYHMMHFLPYVMNIKLMCHLYKYRNIFYSLCDIIRFNAPHLFVTRHSFPIYIILKFHINVFSIVATCNNANTREELEKKWTNIPFQACIVQCDVKRFETLRKNIKSLKQNVLSKISSKIQNCKILKYHNFAFVMKVGHPTAQMRIGRVYLTCAPAAELRQYLSNTNVIFNNNNNSVFWQRWKFRK